METFVFLSVDPVDDASGREATIDIDHQEADWFTTIRQAGHSFTPIEP